jgi:phage terminase large subunit-like protein
MFIEITNSGFDRTSICWEHHEHSRKVAEGHVTDEQWFAYVCALDEGDDPLQDETVWAKVNPNLGVSVTLAYLRAQVKNAINMPLEHNTVLRLNFCVWTHADFRFIDMGKWALCAEEVPDAELVGVPCYAGLDLGLSDDLSAFVRVWMLADGRVAVKCNFWVPEIAQQKFPNRPHDVWKRKGLITVTQGDITDMDLVEREVLRLCRESNVLQCAFDQRFATHMQIHLTEQGVVMVNTLQGDALHEALGMLSDWIVSGKLRHGGHEVLTWMASNAVTRTSRGTGRVRLDKDKSAEKIDGIAALTMAVDRAFRNPVRSDFIAAWV